MLNKVLVHLVNVKVSKGRYHWSIFVIVMTTGQARLIQSHSSARISSKISGNMNQSMLCNSNLA